MSVVVEEIGSPERELTTSALREFLRMYEPGEEDPKTRRKKCSRQDYWCGYRAALIALKAWSHFQVPPR
jgi:hypothetical protein